MTFSTRLFVVFDLQAPVCQPRPKGEPLTEDVIHGLARQALRQMLTRRFQRHHGTFDPGLHGSTSLPRACALSQSRTSPTLSQFGFHGIETGP